jgi:methylated-DNA-protein-cysteine methyltransferase-like protein
MGETNGALSEFAAIYACVRAIPAGRVASYGDVGLSAGATARTVGWAMSVAPEGVPWQRVVGADGYLRIARRSPELALRQRQLLTDEGVVVSDKGYVDRRFFLGADEDDAEAQDTVR